MTDITPRQATAKVKAHMKARGATNFPISSRYIENGRVVHTTVFANATPVAHLFDDFESGEVAVRERFVSITFQL